jgi:hypothetical protein
MANEAREHRGAGIMGKTQEPSKPAAIAAAAAIAAIALAAAALTGCPLPYKYTPDGYPGTSTGADPSTPDISAAPVALYSESSGRSGSVADGQSAATSSDTEITFASATVGAVIYYTIDGSTPDPRSPKTRKYAPGSPLKLAVGNPSSELSSASVTARATAIGPNMKPSLVSTVTVNVQYPRAAAPTFTLPSGAYNEDQKVELSTATPGAAIYYTKVEGNNGSRPAPGQEGTLEYSGPISVRGPSDVWTITAIAVKDQLIASATASATYSIAYDACAAPFFTPAGGTYDNDVILVLHGDANSTIYFTTDGSDPIVGSSPYAWANSEIGLPANVPTHEGRIVLKAVAAETGKNPSPINTAQYLFQAARPAASDSGAYDPATGTYRDGFLLSLFTATSEAIVYYTIDGSDPRTSNTRGYADGPQSIHIARTTRLRAIAVKNGYLDSEEFDHTFTLRAAIPNFTAAGGFYYAAGNIGINDLTPNTTIYYTADGSDPKDASNPSRHAYTGTAIPLNLNGAWLRLRAYAHREDFQDSDVASADYFLALPAPKPQVLNATGSTIHIMVPSVASETACNVQLFRGASTQIYNSDAAIDMEDWGLNSGTQYAYWTRIYYYAADLMVESPGNEVFGWTLNASNLPLLVDVTMPGPYATPQDYDAGFLDSPNDGAGYLSTLNAALVQGGYTYIPYSLGFIPSSSWPGSILIVTFDSNNNAVRSIQLSGARYIYSVTMDGNGNITYNGQGGQHIVINWSDLRF